MLRMARYDRLKGWRGLLGFLLAPVLVLLAVQAAAAAPTISCVQLTADGYRLEGSGFGTDKTKVRVFENNRRVDPVPPVTDKRIDVRSRPTGTVQVYVEKEVGKEKFERSSVVSFTYAVPAITLVQPTEAGYRLEGSGFGGSGFCTEKTAVQVLENNRRVDPNSVTSVTDNRIAVRSRPTGATVQHSVIVGLLASNSVTFTHGPRITRITPDRGPRGSLITGTITGENLVRGRSGAELFVFKQEGPTESRSERIQLAGIEAGSETGTSVRFSLVFSGDADLVPRTIRVKIDGVMSNALSFTVEPGSPQPPAPPVPYISSIIPGAIPAGEESNVTLSGENLSGAWVFYARAQDEAGSIARQGVAAIQAAHTGPVRTILRSKTPTSMQLSLAPQFPPGLCSPYTRGVLAVTTDPGPRATVSTRPITILPSRPPRLDAPSPLVVLLPGPLPSVTIRLSGRNLECVTGAAVSGSPPMQVSIQARPPHPEGLVLKFERGGDSLNGRTLTVTFPDGSEFRQLVERMGAPVAPR